MTASMIIRFVLAAIACMTLGALGAAFITCWFYQGGDDDSADDTSPDKVS